MKVEFNVIFEEMVMLLDKEKQTLKVLLLHNFFFGVFILLQKKMCNGVIIGI